MKQPPDPPAAFDDPLARLHRLAQDVNGAWQPEQRAKLEAILDGLRQREREQAARLADVEQLHEQARASMAGFAELFEFAPDAYLVTDVTGIIERANRAASVLLHTPREFLVRKPLPFYVAPQDRTLFYTRLILLGRGQESAAAWLVRLQPTRGGEVSAELTVTPVLGEGGRLTGLRWQMRDITARTQTENALRAEKEFAESLIE